MEMMMGQFSDIVERQRNLLASEAWRKKVKLIMGEILPDRKLWTTTYNDGAQLFEKYQNGKWTSTSVSSKMTIQECIDQMSREEQDAFRK
jgi:hypothetical protein